MADSRGVFLAGVEFWVWLCASLAFAGWALSAFSLLGGPAYAVVVGLIIVIFALTRGRFVSTSLDWRAEAHKLFRRLKRLPPALFFCIWLFSVIGAFAHPTIHFDSLSYRLPRILHWLAEGRWHWIHTPDTRTNVIACSTEWVWAPMTLLTDSERILSFTNLVSFVFLPGLLYAFFTRVGVRRQMAWWWMWLLPAGYCYAFQAGSLATDSYGTIFVLAAVVYAFKAREQQNAYYLWISLLAIAFATGAKQTNLLAVPLWFIPFATNWRLLFKRPLATIAVAVVAAFASYLPMCVANIKFAGTWKGFYAEPTPPFWAIVGNLFAIPVENLLPPFFPAAREWNAAMERFVETPLGSNFSTFENFGYLYRGPSENLGALGLTTCLVVLLGLVSRRARGQVRSLFRGMNGRMRLALLVLPWLLVLVYMATITIARAARYLAFFYPFLLAGVLVFCNRPFRFRWWRVAACASILTTLFTMMISRQRPLFPVQWTSRLVAAAGLPGLAEKARSAYSWTGEVRQAIDAFHEALPPETKVAGYVSEAGNLEVSLWHPYGARRVWRFSGKDSPEMIDSKGVEYLIVDHTALESSGAGSIENWVQRYGGEVVFTAGMPPEPDFPKKDAYLVKMSGVSRGGLKE